MNVQKLTLLLLCVSVLYACSAARRDVYQTVPQGKSYVIASWYGPKFHGRPTSSGEIYDMYKETCAHKTYVFGTRLKVTNPANNKTVVCVVNDRGPFIEGRDLDLSYASAKKIGLIGPGVARVLIEPMGRDFSYVKIVSDRTSGRKGPFAIQVGSFRESVNAVRLKTALGVGYRNVYIQEVFIKGRKYFRVRIGTFGQWDKALSVAERLGQIGYKAIIVSAEVEL
jgi:rare lipoprotein A